MFDWISASVLVLHLIASLMAVPSRRITRPVQPYPRSWSAGIGLPSRSLNGVDMVVTQSRLL